MFTQTSKPNLYLLIALRRCYIKRKERNNCHYSAHKKVGIRHCHVLTINQGRETALPCPSTINQGRETALPCPPTINQGRETALPCPSTINQGRETALPCPPLLSFILSYLCVVSAAVVASNLVQIAFKVAASASSIVAIANKIAVFA